MSVEEASEAFSGHDDLDDDIERLKFVLQDDQKQNEGEIDGELQVLENADEAPYSYASRPSTTLTSSDVTASSFPTTSMGTEADDFVIRFDPSAVNAETCLDMNRAYQEVLLDTLRQIEMALNENRVRQKELSNSLEEKSTKGVKPQTSKLKPLSEYTAPYFRDFSGNPAPSNPDVQIKIAMREDKQLVRPKPGWSKSERKRLLNAVRLDAREQQIRPIMNKLEVATGKTSKCKTPEEIEECKERIETLKDEIIEKQKLGTDELFQSVDINKIDFMKISAMEFKGKYNPSECESMWRNVLRPGINREKWSKEEEIQLSEIAAKHGSRNWKAIAEELGTRRTPFQCLQRYQKDNYVFDESEWTHEEDELLREVVDTCQIGSAKIPWHQVAYYMERRSARQCRMRWQKITPYLKRGRWTSNEDCLLNAAVQMVGDNDWLRVQDFVPFRSAQQCRERWQNCLDPDLKFGQWTYEEDKELLTLHEKHKNNWVAISCYMPGRTDHMCLARHKILLKWKKNSDIFNNEPREVQKSLMSPFFEMNSAGQVLPKKGFLPTLPSQKKKRKYLDDDEDFEVEDETGDQWVKFAREQELQPSDYLKQIQDTKNNDIVVPRPPPLRRYAPRAYSSTWARRKAIQKLVQACINTSEEKDGVADPEMTVENVSEQLSSIMQIDKQDKEKWELISNALRGQMPHQLTVSTLLEISRSIKTTGKIPEYIEANSKYEYEEEMEESEEDESEESSMSEEETESESDEEPVPEKPKRVLTKAEQETVRLRLIKVGEHKVVRAKIREKIRYKMGLTQFNKRERGRQRVYNLYPKSKTSEGPGDIVKIANKSLAILLKSFDVDGQAVYKNANSLKRKHSAAALLKSTDCRRSKRKLASRTNTTLKSDEMETADLVLSLRRQLDIEESDDEMELDPDQIKVEVVDESFENFNSADQTRAETGECNRINNFAMIGSSRVEQNGTCSQDLNETNQNQSRFSQDQSGISQNQSGTSQNQAGTSEGQSGICHPGLSLVNDHLSVAEGENQQSIANQRSIHQETLKKLREKLNKVIKTERQVASTSTKVEEDSSVPVKGAAAKDSYEKVLPYMPPNLSNLHAMKCLLLEHRNLINTSGGFFDKDDLKSHLYSIRNRGLNPLLPVFMSVGNLRPRAKKKNKAMLNLDTHSLLKKTPKRMVVGKIRKTRAYQLLKARFQSLFVWPALMATIARPKIETPENIEDKPDILVDNVLEISDTLDAENDTLADAEIEHVAVHVNEEEYLDGEEGSMETENDTNIEADLEAEVVRENVARAVEEVMEAEGKTLTEEEAIEKLVEKILMEYKASRESKKTYTRRSRRKASELARQAIFNRERTKILKRLGLWEKMKQYRRQREEQQAKAAEAASTETMDTSTDSIPEQNVTDLTDEQPMSNSSEQNDTKKPGRPFGAKNFKSFMKKYTENVRKSSRQGETPAYLKNSILPEKKEGGKTRAKRLTRLKELIPDKMPNLASQIPEVSVMIEEEPEAEQPEPEFTRVRARRRKKTPIGHKDTAAVQVNVEADAEIRNNGVESNSVVTENGTSGHVDVAMNNDCRRVDLDTCADIKQLNSGDKSSEALDSTLDGSNDKTDSQNRVPLNRPSGDNAESQNEVPVNRHSGDDAESQNKVPVNQPSGDNLESQNEVPVNQPSGDNPESQNKVPVNQPSGDNPESQNKVPVNQPSGDNPESQNKVPVNQPSGDNPESQNEVPLNGALSNNAESQNAVPVNGPPSDNAASQNGVPVNGPVEANQLSSTPKSDKDTGINTSGVSELPPLTTDNSDHIYTGMSSQATGTSSSSGESVLQQNSTQVPSSLLVSPDDRSSSQEQPIVMMAIPVKVGDQQQFACVPVQMGTDGKLTLHPPTPVSKAPSSNSDT